MPSDRVKSSRVDIFWTNSGIGILEHQHVSVTECHTPFSLSTVCPISAQAQAQHNLVNPGHTLAISCNPGIRGMAQMPTNACGSRQGRGSEQIAWTEGSSLRGDEGE